MHDRQVRTSTEWLAAAITTTSLPFSGQLTSNWARSLKALTAQIAGRGNIISPARDVRDMAGRLALLTFFAEHTQCGLTKKAEPPPARDVNRDSGTASANSGWLRREAV